MARRSPEWSRTASCRATAFLLEPFYQQDASTSTRRRAGRPLPRCGPRRQPHEITRILCDPRDSRRTFVCTRTGRAAGESALTCRSRPLEDPHIVLVAATAAELFRGSKTAPAILQFIPKGDGQLTVWTVDSPRDH